ncbi:MAG TPA: hypothetical protein VG273_17260 [Bryobacteraceae bacterium]|jgi:hypothetical protein|nr:hypothetical protein [Bryobacteraceae bacterium]
MRIPILIAALALTGPLVLAQTDIEVQMILTAADHINHKPVPVNASAIQIMDATVTDVIQFQRGEDLDIFVLIDDAANYEFGSKLRELREFVTEQPPGVSIGVAYIHDGMLQVAENPTKDHARAARALRAPAGSKVGNPYCALSDLMGRWPKKSMRHEVILVSTGFDDTATEPGDCVNAQVAIHDAERTNTIVYALYNPVENFASEDWSRTDRGVADLAHVAYETGGEAYLLGHLPLDSIAPFLDDIAEHLDNQYLVKLKVAPGPASEFRSIFIIPPRSLRQELMAPESIWVSRQAATNTREPEFR